MATTPRIGTMLRRARERKRMSQKQLAEALGVSRSAVNAWENDRAWPQNSIGALEQILGVSLTGEPEVEELVPRNEWERATLADPDLPDEIKRAFVLEWRAARAAYKEQERARQESGRSAARHRAAG